MKKTLTVIALAASFAFAGAAQAALMDSTFGNTVTVSSGGQTVVTYHFNADGTVSMTMGDGTQDDSTWTLEGNTLCIATAEGPDCNEIEDRDVGETWTETDGDGNTMTITITEGQ